MEGPDRTEGRKMEGIRRHDIFAAVDPSVRTIAPVRQRAPGGSSPKQISIKCCIAHSNAPKSCGGNSVTDTVEALMSP